MTTRADPQAISTLRTTVAVLRADGHYRVMATRAIKTGEAILVLEGEVCDRPTRFTIQIGPDRHLDAPPADAFEQALDHHPWQFLNHSCRPNAALRDENLVALCDIAPWEQVTFDYNSTEWRLATPFDCRCGAADCCGEVRGYSALNDAERNRRKPYLAPHLLDVSGEAHRTD